MPEGGPRDLGVLRLGGTRVAVPLDALREVVPHPATLHALPIRADGLVGALELRGTVVPVLDLGPTVGVEVGREVVAVVEHAGRVVGIRADEAVGLMRAEGGGVPQHVERAGPVGGVVVDPRSGSVVAVLDLDLLLDLPGVPLVAGATTGADSLHGTAGAATRRPMMVVRADGLVLALDVATVTTVLPPTAPGDSVLRGGPCLGAVRHRGTEIAVLDPLLLLGLGRTDPGPPGPLALLRRPDGHVLLQLAEVLRIVELGDEDLVGVPDTTLRRPDLVRGMADVEGLGPVLVVDGEALLREPELDVHARLETVVGDDPTGTTAGTITAAAGTVDEDDLQVLLHAGTRVSVPLDQVEEFVPVPTDGRTPAADPDTDGLVLHRGRSLPLVPLARVLGHGTTTPGASSCVVVVRLDGQAVGFVADRLDRIDRPTWRQPDEQVAAGARPLLGFGPDDDLVPAVDLHALAASVLARA